MGDAPGAAAGPVLESVPVPEPEPVIVARALEKRFGDSRAVAGISFAVPPGVCFGLLGPNGAGKTTTLRMMLGQTHPSAGSLEVLGRPMPAARRAVLARTGVVPQIDNLDPDFTVRENLLVYARYFGLREREVAPRIAELLELVALGERAEVPIGSLSGGMKRRLSLARALVNDPELLILDEPTTGLDPQVRHLIWSWLRELRTRGKTLVLTTHYMEEAERLCDELIVMDGGEIVGQGHPKALIREHVEPHVFEIQGAESGLAEGLLRAARHERVDQTHYLYAQDAGPLVAQLERSDALTYLHRPANLEDVFLRLTGRDLRD